MRCRRTKGQGPAGAASAGDGVVEACAVALEIETQARVR